MLEELFHPDFVLHLAGASFSGIEAMRTSFATQWFERFPDVAVRTAVPRSNNDVVANSLVFTGRTRARRFTRASSRRGGCRRSPRRGARSSSRRPASRASKAEEMTEMWEDFDRVRLFLQLGVAIEVPAL